MFELDQKYISPSNAILKFLGTIKPGKDIIYRFLLLADEEIIQCNEKNIDSLRLKKYELK